MIEYDFGIKNVHNEMKGFIKKKCLSANPDEPPTLSQNFEQN